MTRHTVLIWTLFCLVAGGVFGVYAMLSLAGGRGEFVMPLDDVYIHFQYARQLAAGQLYIYNPGQLPTSGATSFLYPFVLAAGHLAGFQGLRLGLWALLVGMGALAVSQLLIYRLARAADVPETVSISAAMLFALTGAVAWHYMSGMETGLMILLTLWTLDAVVHQQRRIFILVAALLALIRPEGGIMAVLAVGIMALRAWRDPAIRRRERLLLLLPILALGLQPLVNWAVTGSAVASGNQSKSILGMVPFIPTVVIDLILNNWGRLWAELLTGISPCRCADATNLMYLLPLTGGVGLLGLGLVAWRKRWWRVALLIVGWLLAVSLAVATLDTAFWHFKRYQMPLLVLVYVTAVWAVGWLARRMSRFWLLAVGLWVGLTGGVLLLFAQFAAFYALNVSYVAAQPLPMARWLAAHTPPDATIAVHDTGMMRYMGGRTTLDMVGLTTPGAAEYWRNGPGAVAEFIMRAQPDYIASYGRGHGYGLALLADTSLYGAPLAAFPVQLTAYANVALAADFQGIYQPDYTPQAHRTASLQSSLRPFLAGFTLVDSVNVADVRAEHDHAYSWYSVRPPDGFPTDVYEITYLACESNCRLRDGGRRINGGETFTVSVTPGQDVLLITRVNAMHRVEYNVYANDQFIGTRFIPQERGRWIEVPTLIPAAYVTSERLTITHQVNSDQGDYVPYYHLIYQGSYPAVTALPLLAQAQSGAIALTDVNMRVTDNRLIVDLTWLTPGGARGDYAIFVHLYADPGAPQLAQADVRPGQNALPPGNWLPGTLRDTIPVQLDALAAGTYQVALGLYHPVTFERLPFVAVAGDRLRISPDGRIFIGEVEWRS